MKRRHGRVRRWVVRPFFWGLAVLTLATALLVAYLGSDAFARLAGDRAIDWLEARLGREVSIGSIDLDLLPLRIEAENVRIAGPTAEAPPFATARRIEVDATVGSLLRPGMRLDHVVIEAPRLSVRYDEAGGHDAPSWSRRTDRVRSDRLLDLEVGLVAVLGGSIDLNDTRFPLEFTASGLEASLVGGSDVRELVGRASASAVEVTLPSGRPYLGELRLDGSYRPGRVDIRQARASGPDLDASLSGVWRWRDVRDVELKIIADSRLEILDRLGLASGLGAGPFRFEGTLRRVPGEWFVSGDLESPSVVLLDRRLAAVDGRILGNRDALVFDIDSSRYGGGSLAGSVTLPLERSRPVGVSLRLEAVALARLLSDQSIPVEGLAGAVHGVVDYQFERALPRRGDGWAELEVRPLPASSASGGRRELAVAGTVPLSIGDGTIRTQAIRLVAERQLMTARGFYDLASSSGSFDYDITTGDAGELVALLPLEPEPAAWQPLSGTGTLGGRLELSPAGVSSSVRLDLSDVEATGYSAASMRGGFVVTPAAVEALRLELTRTEGAMLVGGSVPFDGVAEAPAFAVSIDAAGWPLEDVAVWMPWELPAGGDFSGSVELSGTLEMLQGRVDGRVEPVRTEFGEIAALDLDLGFSPQRVAVDTARLVVGDGSVEASGGVSLPEGGLDLVLSSRALRLAALPFLADLPGRLDGNVELEAVLGGTLTEPSLTALVRCDAVAVDGRMPEDSKTSTLEVDWSRQQLAASGSAGGLFDLRGGGELGAAGADLLFEVESARLGPLLALLTSGEESMLDGSGSGRLAVRGTLAAGSNLAVELVAQRLELVRGELSLVNLEPVALDLDGSGVTVRSLYLGAAGSSSEIFVRGRLEGGDQGGLDLDVQASLAGEWMTPWLPGVDVAAGVFDAIGQISGSVAAPSFNGVGEIRGAELRIPGYGGAFENVGVIVLFYPRRAVIESGVADVAGGRVQVSGAVQLGDAAVESYRIQASGTDLGFRYPEGWLVRVDTDLTLASTETGRLVSGALRLDRAVYTRDVPLEIDQLLRVLFQRRRIEAGDVEPWRSETALNLSIEASEGLRIKNNLADLSGRAELVLRGNLARPVVFGTVELDPGGSLVYGGQEFAVERGSLSFANPYRIEPVIDLLAATEMREYDITLSLAGTLDRLQADFVSDPPLPELEVLALLTGGRDPRQVAPDPRDPSVASVAADSFLYGQATSLIAGRFNRLFGLDQFRIDPLTSSTGDLSSARVTVGKRLSRDVFATYSYDPVQTDEQILELEWNISRSLVLVLTQNGDGTYAVDARWEKAL